MSTLRKAQAGFGLVTAIFMMVVMAGLAVAMVALTTAQQASSGLDILGARAYQAARSGAEWALFRYSANNNSCPAPSSTFSLPATATTLSGFTIVVTCSANAAGTAVIRSTACMPGPCTNSPTSPDYIQRVVEARATTFP